MRFMKQSAAMLIACSLWKSWHKIIIIIEKRKTRTICMGRSDARLHNNNLLARTPFGCLWWLTRATNIHAACCRLACAAFVYGVVQVTTVGKNRAPSKQAQNRLLNSGAVGVSSLTRLWNFFLLAMTSRLSWSLPSARQARATL